ncbi:unnamed protein product [Clonostachys rosea f. rosea IK726]|uniref:Laccase n=2 Tax=Bionectria ochroleuca TaxID=29856 RepID=A0A0B7K2P2_BIOOC|nr:unnamed protein product [Clonostachys rosea f. rosea IK726]
MSHSQKLTQSDRLSLLGTLLAPLLPAFLTNNPLPNGAPWSLLNSHTNYYEESPNTGVIRAYDFTISRGKLAPDGVQREVLMINGGFPGPTIEANWGDTIQVTVHNQIEDEGVALHWHGFLQTSTPWEDGSPAVTQCPIAPGKSYTYKLHANLYGTSWYHSHYSAQYAGGLTGPIVIHGPPSIELEQYDIDIGPIMLSDWYHAEYFDLVEQTMTNTDFVPVYADNNLINGKMSFNCSTLLPRHNSTPPCFSDAGISKFRFKRGKKHLLRLINSGSEGLQRFSIDGHILRVVSNDFVAINPYETKVVTLGIGQRTDVVVTANGELDAYWMRSNVSRICGLNHSPDAVAAIYYDDTDDKLKPASQAWNVPDPGTCANDDLDITTPIMELRVPEHDLYLEMPIDLFVNGSGVTLWSMDRVSFRGNYNSPTLLLANLGNLTFEEEWNVRNLKDSKSVRVNVINNSNTSHPIHMHGFNMYILHEGPGTWDGTIINPHNPIRRDVYQLRPNGHLVIQFDAAANPGVWPFHCHIAWHVSAGFFIQFLTNPEEVAKMRVPSVVAETCREWAEWTGTNIPAQIDSGL